MVLCCRVEWREHKWYRVVSRGGRVEGAMCLRLSSGFHIVYRVRVGAFVVGCLWHAGCGGGVCWV